MFETVDADGRRIKLATTVNENGEHTIAVAGAGGGGGSSQVEVTNFPATQPVSGPLTNAELVAQALATAALQDAGNTVLASILTELQTLNTAMVTANGHLATIAANTAGTPGA